MLPKNVNDNNAPDKNVYWMFSQLTEENKEKAVRFIADLKEKR